jgi:hypothetical protein
MMRPKMKASAASGLQADMPVFGSEQSCKNQSQP